MDRPCIGHSGGCPDVRAVLTVGEPGTGISLGLGGFMAPGVIIMG